MLKEEAKFRIIDPQELLAPLNQEIKNSQYKKYEDLITYLQNRYWKK